MTDAIPTDISKTFDYIKHELVIGKLKARGCENEAVANNTSFTVVG